MKAHTSCVKSGRTTGPLSIFMFALSAGQGKHMSDFLDSPIVQFVIFGLAVMGFFILVKAGSAKLPDAGPAGAVKKAVQSA